MKKHLPTKLLQSRGKSTLTLSMMKVVFMLSPIKRVISDDKCHRDEKCERGKLHELETQILVGGTFKRKMNLKD